MELRQYQIELSSRAASIIRAKGLCYLAMECRTGKTITALSTAEKYGALSVLFVTKKKAINSVKSDHATMLYPFAMEVVNYESLHKVNGDFDFIIVDEAHSLGQYPKPSKRFCELRAKTWTKPVLYLSGTPSPESYAQLYHQFAISIRSPWQMHVNFYKWAHAGYVNIHERMVNGNKINDYSETNAELIAKDIAPYLLTYTQEQAGFETEIEEHELHVIMSSETREALRVLKRDRVIYTEGGGAILADTPAALLNKMHQISGGTVIDDQGKRQVIDKSKAEAIRKHFEGLKIAIFYVYQAEGDLLKETFPRWTDSPEVFQESPDLAFIAQVRSAREGVRLDTADAIVFYSMEYSFLSYEQARQRALSKERETPAKVFYCIGDCGIDGEILEAVRNKQDFTLSYYYANNINNALRCAND